MVKRAGRELHLSKAADTATLENEWKRLCSFPVGSRPWEPELPLEFCCSPGNQKLSQEALLSTDPLSQRSLLFPSASSRTPPAPGQVRPSVAAPRVPLVLPCYCWCWDETGTSSIIHGCCLLHQTWPCTRAGPSSACPRLPALSTAPGTQQAPGKRLWTEWMSQKCKL